jgi:hypothetical protein
MTSSEPESLVYHLSSLVTKVSTPEFVFPAHLQENKLSSLFNFLSQQQNPFLTYREADIQVTYLTNLSALLHHDSMYRDLLTNFMKAEGSFNPPKHLCAIPFCMDSECKRNTEGLKAFRAAAREFQPRELAREKNLVSLFRTLLPTCTCVLLN